MRDEVRNVIRLRQHQHHRHIRFLRQQSQKLRQLGTSRHIQSYERIIHDEHPRIRHQRLRQLKLPQFTTAQQDDMLIQQLLQMEYLIQMLSNLLQILVHQHPILLFLTQSFSLLLRRLVTHQKLVKHCLSRQSLLRYAERLCQQILHQWSLLNVILVPTLLVVVHPLIRAIRIPERQILDVVAHHLRLARSEIILHPLHRHQRTLSHQHIHQSRLAAAVVTHNGQLFTSQQLKVDRSPHPHLRMTHHSTLYLDNLLHTT